MKLYFCSAAGMQLWFWLNAENVTVSCGHTTPLRHSPPLICSYCLYPDTYVTGLVKSEKLAELSKLMEYGYPLDSVSLSADDEEVPESAREMVTKAAEFPVSILPTKYYQIPWPHKTIHWKSLAVLVAWGVCYYTVASQ